MSNGKQFERLWKLSAAANDLVLASKRKPAELADALQQFIVTRVLSGDVDPKAIVRAAESANVYCYEDDTSQHSLIKHLPSQVAGCEKTIPVIVDPDADLTTRVGSTKTLLDAMHCCLTDVMFNGQPKGLGVATHAVSCNMPCVIVTRSIEAGGHHPLWVTHALHDLARHPYIAVFETVGSSGPKPWREAYTALMGLQWKFWLAEPSTLGNAVRRFQKYVIDGNSTATEAQLFVIRGKTIDGQTVYLSEIKPCGGWSPMLEGCSEFTSQGQADQTLVRVCPDPQGFAVQPRVIPVE